MDSEREDARRKTRKQADKMLELSRYTVAILSKLLPAAPGEVGCIGGPVGALEDVCHGFGGNSLRYIVQLTQVMTSYKPRMEFFPDTSVYKEDLIDADIPGIHELLDDDKIKTREKVQSLDKKSKERVQKKKLRKYGHMSKL